MKFIHLLLAIVILSSISSCSSVYKKHYDKGFTLLQHKKQAHRELSGKAPDIQHKTITALNQDIKKQKAEEQKKAEKSYQTLHKSLNKIENNAPGRVLSSINKFSLKKIEALKTDTLYRKEPLKNSNTSLEIRDKAQNALIFAIVSIVTFWFLWIFSLIPAIIALAMVKKANAMAKLNGDALPSDANTARIIAWVTIGLNLLSLLIVILYILFIIILLAGI